METVNFKAGDTIIAKGESGDTAYLIVSGSVEVSVGVGAKEKILATLNAGEVFGEMCLIKPGPRSATVKARVDTTCTTTSYKKFVDSIQDNPAQAIQFMRTLVQRLRQMDEMIEAGDPKRKGLFRAMFQDWQQESTLVPPEELYAARWWMML
jgi:CRP/FNR family transcriptional regulator, cyclic AMP receptor protein